MPPKRKNGRLFRKNLDAFFVMLSVPAIAGCAGPGVVKVRLEFETADEMMPAPVAAQELKRADASP